MLPKSQNFNHLELFDIQLVRLGSLAERYFAEDPVTALIKLRQFGEHLAQLAAANLGIYEEGLTQAELLRKLKQDTILNKQLSDAFQFLRLKGNAATHEHQGNHQEALSALKIAHQLGIWFQRTFGRDKGFSTGVFVPPQNNEALSTDLQKELDTLRQELKNSLSEAEGLKLEADSKKQALLSAQDQIEQATQDRLLWEQLALEAEQAKHVLEEELKTLQQNAENAPKDQLAQAIQLAQASGNQFTLDEAATRSLIDQQLRERGWEADSKSLRYSEGIRPSKGRNIAIAEWPTASGPADYALFIGQKCMAVIEAKKQNKNVSSTIEQAERYSRGFRFDGTESVGGPWADGQAETLTKDCTKGPFQVH